MRRLPRVSRRFLIAQLALVGLVLSMVAAPATTLAQYYDVHSNAPFEQLTGLQFAGQRLYQGSNELNIYLDVAVFDTAENAAAGLTALNTYYLDAYAIAASPIPFEPVDPPADMPGAMAYHGFLDIGNGPYAEIAFVQVQDGTTVLTAFVSNYAYDSNPEELAMEVAGAMLETILATPVELATPATVNPLGIMERLPLETGEVPARYGMTYSGDTDWFVPESIGEPTVAATPDTNDPGNLLYGDAGGLEMVVSRSYSTLGAVPQDAYIEIAAFADEASAETGYANAGAALLNEIDAAGYDLEETSADVSGDETRAWAGQIEDVEGYIAILTTMSGPYVVTVLVSGPEEDAVLGIAAGLAQAVLDADAGDGDEQFSRFGDSTGGLWDKLPADGDDALQGLEPYSDDQLYP
jgi:hypothetical protein